MTEEKPAYEKPVVLVVDDAALSVELAKRFPGIQVQTNIAATSGLPAPIGPKPAPMTHAFADDKPKNLKQGARLAKQKLDFTASEKCIARIKARNANR